MQWCSDVESGVDLVDDLARRLASSHHPVLLATRWSLAAHPRAALVIPLPATWAVQIHSGWGGRWWSRQRKQEGLSSPRAGRSFDATPAVVTVCPALHHCPSAGLLTAERMKRVESCVLGAISSSAWCWQMLAGAVVWPAGSQRLAGVSKWLTMCGEPYRVASHPPPHAANHQGLKTTQRHP